MLRVDPEPFESLTAPSGSTSSPPRVKSRGEIEGRLFFPRSSPPSAVALLRRTGERGLSAVKGSIATPFTAQGLLMYKRDICRPGPFEVVCLSGLPFFFG